MHLYLQIDNLNVEVCEEFSHVFRKHMLETAFALSIFATYFKIDILHVTYVFVEFDEVIMKARLMV